MKPIDVYHELLTEEPIIVSVMAAAAMRVTLDQYKEKDAPEEVSDFMDRFMENLDELADEAYPA